jgi:NAD(P)-dependent dehydrogenase (short-subunit alcohol dehydrogenase family)
MFAVLFVCAICTVCSAMNTNQVPKSIKPSLSTTNKIAIGGLVAGGLALNKKYNLDGPTFNEPVDLSGQNIVITGANTGLGKDSAIKLASLGGNVYILCKSLEKGKAAVEDIKQKSGNENVYVLQCNLANLDSVRACAKALGDRVGKIDVLMNNAGVMAVPERMTTDDGFEMQLGINHLGHFALTTELFELLKKAPAARVINVSSTAHLLGKLNRDDLMLANEGAYAPWQAYGNSKLSNILFTRGMASKLQAAGSSITALTCHPGGCRTELGRYIIDPATIPKYVQPLLGAVLSPALYFTKSSEQGAQTQIYLSASTKVSNANTGMYYDNSKPADTSGEAKDPAQAMWLWDQSEKLIGKKFNI